MIARIRSVRPVIAVCLLAAALASGAGCGSDSPSECGDIRSEPKVINGTDQPTHVPLLPAQLLAIGSFGGCSGTVIAPTWVLTAKHCGLRVESTSFCVGEQPDSPDVCIAALRVEDHPEFDLTLVELAEDARARLPGLVPIPIMTEIMDTVWEGRTAEAAGYGQTETGSMGTRFFTAEPIVSVSTEFVTVDGEGDRGLCFGDSGGPVMVIAADSTVRVAGALSTGDTSCRGRDNFTRTDRLQDYIEGFTGPTEAVGAGCGLVDGVGQCDGAIALWCQDGELRTDDCAASACGWDPGESAFRCIQGTDPCQGYDRLGDCDGNVARWCEDGVPKSASCESCGSRCDRYASSAGAYCVEDACMGIDFTGRCNGNVAEWCQDGELLSRDCSNDGLNCEFVDDDIGYFCN